MFKISKNNYIKIIDTKDIGITMAKSAF